MEDQTAEAEVKPHIPPRLQLSEPAEETSVLAVLREEFRGTSAQWRLDARCKELSKNEFFPPESDTESNDRAKAVCAGCFVAQQCLEFALSTRQEDGVWGGMSARERRSFMRQRRVTQARE